MRGFARPILLSLIVYFMISGIASANTYYIAANGSDSNNGTSKTTSWLHAPGMAKCTASCASYKPAAGDSIIFRGGDTWHYGNSSASPYTGAWTWNWSGSSGNPIYVGVDQTWYTGGSWARPIISGDNALSTGFVASCTYDQSSSMGLNLNQVSYVTVDNFEWPGRCWSSTSSYSAAIYNYETCNVTLSNNYFHGWTTVVTSADDQMILGNANGSCGLRTNNVISGNVFDGSDSSAGAANSAACSAGFAPNYPCQSGMGIYSEGYDIHGNVFRYLSNMAVTNNTVYYHDNLAEYLYTSYSPSNIAPHSNVLNNDQNIPGGSIYFYNNVVRHTYVTEDFFLTVGAGGTAYLFNNVFYDNMRYSASDTAPQNCITFQAQASTGTESLYFYNNTFDNDTEDATGGGCQLQFFNTSSPTFAWNGTAYFENNHLIGYGTLPALYTCRSGAACSFKDNGNELFQTEAVANGQGYVQGNDYAPTSGGSTIRAGAVNSTTTCSTFSASTSSGLCWGTSDGASEQSGGGGEMASYPTISTVQRAPAWDIGAYQFGGASAPSPPTGLAAVVQ
jgi:hypothetical protein